MTTLRYDNIEATAFKIVNDPSVNPFPMDDVQVQLVNGELMVYMRGHVGPSGQQPGALVAFTLPVVNNVLGAQMIYSGLNYEMKIDEASSALLRCFESDLKWCIAAPPNSTTNISNVMDGSSQKNYAEGGMWQIDNAVPVWVDSGFKPGPFPPNQWNRVAIRQSINPTTNQFSFLSITDGGATFSIPPNLRPLPLLSTNWDGTAVQVPQLCLQKTGFVVVWIRNVSAIFSDAPILATS